MSEEKEVKTTRCIHCNGGKSSCFHCKGSGRVITGHNCFHCKGLGIVTCDMCHGTQIITYTGCGCTIL